MSFYLFLKCKELLSRVWVYDGGIEWCKLRTKHSGLYDSFWRFTYACAAVNLQHVMYGNSTRTFEDIAESHMLSVASPSSVNKPVVNVAAIRS